MKRIGSNARLIFLLLAFELVLNLAIIYKVPYTEIDYKAYMQQIDLISKGQRDYLKIYGDTGPLVYPAGFVYIFGILYWLNLSKFQVQFVFAVLNVSTLFVVLKIYSKSKISIPLVLLMLSRRIHSIYVLRLFNDPFAMFFLYAAILSLLNKHSMISSILFSIALSIKMNVLLFFPGFGVILWQMNGAYKTIRCLAVMLLIQYLVALPFILEYPRSYFNRAFDFGRQFEFIWTVNWKMMPQDLFYSSEFSRTLLVLHMVHLFLFLKKWCLGKGILNTFFNGCQSAKTTNKTLTDDDVLYILFTSNLVGIVFARSLHFQFYAWYYHTLPYLLWRCDFSRIFGFKYANTVARLGILSMIELSWNMYPSTWQSSTNLLIQHSILLYSLLIPPKNNNDNNKS